MERINYEPTEFRYYKISFSEDGLRHFAIACLLEDDGLGGYFFAFTQEGQQLHGTREAQIVAWPDVRFHGEVYALSPLCYDRGAPWPSHVFRLPHEDFPLDDQSEFILNSRAIRQAIVDGMQPKIPKLGVKRVSVPMTQAGFLSLFGRFHPYERTKEHIQGAISLNVNPATPISPEEYGLVSELGKVEPSKAFAMVRQAKDLLNPVEVSSGRLPTLKLKEKRFKAKALPQTHRLKVKETYRQEETLQVVTLTGEQIEELESLVGHFSSRREKTRSTPSFFLAPINGQASPFFQASFHPLDGKVVLAFSYEYRAVNLSN